MEQLTLKQAIEQGYTHYGFAHREWQHAEELHDDLFKEVEEGDHENLVLFEKKPSYPSISKENIAERLAEYISDNDYEECHRDDECVYTSVKGMDFSEVANTINEALKVHKYWMLTDIKILPNK